MSNVGQLPNRIFSTSQHTLAINTKVKGKKAPPNFRITQTNKFKHVYNTMSDKPEHINLRQNPTRLSSSVTPDSMAEEVCHETLHSMISPYQKSIIYEQVKEPQQLVITTTNKDLDDSMTLIV